MARRIAEMFDDLRGRRAALITYATGFYPDREMSASAITAMMESGADAVEIGIPFSDPVLDGPVIQRSSAAALGAGATPAGVLELAAEVRTSSRKPVILMSYYNPVFRYGLADFARDACSAGADAVAIPDLPVEEMGPWRSACASAGIDTIAFCSQTTSDARISEAGLASSGFLYCISLLGTTGPREELSSSLEGFMERVRACTSDPAVIGVGISTPEQCGRAGDLADGVIVGSSLVRRVCESSADHKPLREAVSAMATALRRPGQIT